MAAIIGGTHPQIGIGIHHIGAIGIGIHRIGIIGIRHIGIIGIGITRIGIGIGITRTIGMIGMIGDTLEGMNSENITKAIIN